MAGLDPDTKLLLQPVKIVVGNKLGFPVWDTSVACGVEIPVMQIHVVETEIIPERMDMHLSYTLGIVPGFGEFAGHCVSVIPRYIVFVSKPPVVALLHSGVECRAGRDAAWTSAVSAVKTDSFGCKCVQVWSLYIRVSGIAKTVAAKLISHDQYDIRLFHFSGTPFSFWSVICSDYTIIHIGWKSKKGRQIKNKQQDL